MGLKLVTSRAAKRRHHKGPRHRIRNVDRLGEDLEHIVRRLRRDGICQPTSGSEVSGSVSRQNMV